MVNSKVNDDYLKLIADIYYDSGLSRVVFNKVYMNTLKKYLSKLSADDRSALLNSVKLALRKRRTIYFPDGVCAEDVHLNKDVWTFVVFLSGLIIHENVHDVKLFLKKTVDVIIITWLEDKNAVATLYSIGDIDSKDVNVQKIRGFYGLSHNGEAIDIYTEKEGGELQKHTTGETLSTDTLGIETLTNKDVGKLFIEWMLAHKKNVNKMILIEDGYFLVKSPLVFIEFSKIDQYSWKSVQKGVIKLCLHEANEANGTPFHKIKGVNMMKFDSGIKAVLCNHADYQDQKHR